MNNVIVILGPTASGKSALGVQLAKKFGGVILSADSRQVYRDMDIGTGKITVKEMDGVPHFLLDVASPRSQYSVARYVREASRIIKKIPTTQPIFLVGGSPFYIDALTKPNSFSPVPPNAALRRRLVELSSTTLLQRLEKLDPRRASTIDIHNRRRLIRAIEIASYSSPPRGGGVAHRAGVVESPPMRILKIGIQINQKTLYKNIDHRVDGRMKHGMTQEVARLHAEGLSWKKLEAFGLEYRFLSQYLQDQLSKQEAIEQLKHAIHHFAKRQMTWWKRDQEIHWITKKIQAEKIIRPFLT